MAELLTREKKAIDYWQAARKKGAMAKLGRESVRVLLRAVPGFLMAFSEVCGVPLGAWASYGAALCATGEAAWMGALGVAGAFLMRLLWGLQPRWELLLGAAMLVLLPHVMKKRGGVWLLGASGVLLLPGAVMAVAGASAQGLLQGVAAMLIGTLLAPVMERAIVAISTGRGFDTLESRLSVGYLLLMMLCGAARMMLPGVNLGVLGASCMVLAAAMQLGVSSGCVMGLMAGVVLSLQGLSLCLPVALALGGFLAGMGQAIGRRQVSCALFALGAGGMLVLYGASGLGALGGVAAAGVLLSVLPRAAMERLGQQTRRFHPQALPAGDAYASYALRRWEQTVNDMAQAVPSPLGLGEKRDGAWWEERLCASCPEKAQCGCMNTELGAQKAESVWRWRDASDTVWAQHRETLRGLGCARLYLLMESMDVLRAEHADMQRQLNRACQQRDMLVTHLTALAGSARRYAALSIGESWWDERDAAKLRRALAEANSLARLAFVRQMDGHAQVAYELHGADSSREQAAALCTMTSQWLEKPMTIAEESRTHVLLREMPLMMVEIGAAGACASGETSGDTYYLGQLQDGRFIAALSDGMGHGDAAAVESRQTVELLRLCLDAGYDRSQTLTAVNGMMLLAGRGERFSTVDLLLLDLWTGQATLDKLGAAGSYLVQEGKLRRITGDALPLGILEDVESGENRMRMQPGDMLLLLSDGIEDAFGNREEMETVLREAILAGAAQETAEQILSAAQRAQGSACADDQTVLVLHVVDAAPEMTMWTQCQ